MTNSTSPRRWFGIKDGKPSTRTYLMVLPLLMLFNLLAGMLFYVGPGLIINSKHLEYFHDFIARTASVPIAIILALFVTGIAWKIVTADKTLVRATAVTTTLISMIVMPQLLTVLQIQLAYAYPIPDLTQVNRIVVYPTQNTDSYYVDSANASKIITDPATIKQLEYFVENNKYDWNVSIDLPYLGKEPFYLDYDIGNTNLFTLVINNGIIGNGDSEFKEISTEQTDTIMQLLR